MVMASKQLAKADKMSDSESDSQMEVVDKKSGSDEPKRRAAANPVASTSQQKIKPPAKKRGKVEQLEEKKKEDSKNKKATKEKDEESDSEEYGDDQKVPLLDQPLEQSGARSRKLVERFAAEVETGKRQPKDIDIPDGKGTRLKDIPNVSYQINRRGGGDSLKALHRVLFDRLGRTNQIKDNILKFKGFTFDKNSTEYRKKLTALTKIKLLKDILQLLDLPKGGKQPELAERVLEFMMKPTDSGKEGPIARPERKGALSKSYKEANDATETKRAKTKHRKRKLAESSDEEDADDEADIDNEDVEADGDDEADEEEAEEAPLKKNKRAAKAENTKKKSNKKKKVEPEEEKEIENDEDDQNVLDDEDVETEDKKTKKTAPKVAAQAKKRPAPSEKEDKPAVNAGKKQNASNAAKKTALAQPPSEEKNGKAKEGTEAEGRASSPIEKKRKIPPTDEEIKTFVKTILDASNLEEITMKTVCKQVYEHYPEFDLSSKKEFIKVTVKSFIA